MPLIPGKPAIVPAAKTMVRTQQTVEPLLARRMPEENQFRYPLSSPLHLTATTTLGSSSSGGVNSISLKNPLGYAMEILGMKWQLRAPGNTEDTPNILGGIIGCKLDLGKWAITSGFVPVWNFGRTENLTNEVQFNVVDPDAGSAQEYNWRLPRPLYVPAGAVLIPTFQHRGLIADPITIRISYEARSISPNAQTPKTIALPYVASYISSTFTGNEAGEAASVETDLVNPFQDPLILQRFIGRLQIFDAETLEAAEANLAERVGHRLLYVKMRDMNGRDLIRNYTPFRMAFDSLTRSWEMEHGEQMDPESFYSVLLRKDAATFNPYTENYLIQAFISMVGWRNVVGA